MKRLITKILCAACAIALWGNADAQDRPLRIGFQVSPTISWVNNTDNLIIRNGGNFGLKIGTTADFSFRDNYSFTLGISLASHEGGEFLYETGGNYLPNSDLSRPELNTGDKPISDGGKIRYNLQYLEFPVGLKISSKEFGYLRYFVEAPIFTFAFLTRGRGDIETADGIFEKENIYEDLSKINLFWGLGAGAEYAISQNNALTGGIYFQSGLFDFTRNKGYRSSVNPNEDPNDPNDDFIKETDDSRARVSNVMIKLGIIF